MNEQEKKTPPSIPSFQIAARPRPVKFVFEKSTSFRTFHADGAWGMVNGYGNIQIHFFLDHEPLVTSAVYPVHPDGSFTGEVSDAKAQYLPDPDNYIVIRELQAGFVMSVTAAKQVRAMLGNFIDVAEALVQHAKKP